MAIPQIRNISSLSVDDTIKWSDQAVRLAKMDEIITSEPHSGTPQGRQSVIDRLNGLIRKIGAGQELPIGSLDALEGKVIKLYNSIPASQFIGTLAKDVGSVQIPPIKKSMLGMNGPTYLISYPRTGIYTGVFKLTNEVEFSSGAILNIFLRALRDPLIKVPAASFFDINQKRRLSLSESGTTVSPLKNREPNDLGVNFYRFLTLDACKIPQDLLAPDPSHGESSAAKRVDLFDTQS